MFSAFTTSENRFKNLRVFNFVMGFFHLIQGIAMLAVSNETTVRLTTNFLQFDIPALQITSRTRDFAELNLGTAVAAFLFMSAIAHFLVSTIFYDWYVKNLKNGINYARWFEYSLSASWMIIIIGTLVGIFDAPALLLLFVLNATMVFFGLLMEKMNLGFEKKNVDWSAFIYGCIAGVTPWIVLGWYFYGAIQNSNEINEHLVPDFVYIIFISLFVFFNIFALNMFLQYKRVGPWKNYLFGEVMYIVLSLIAKSLLAWQVWSGTLRGEN